MQFSSFLLLIFSAAVPMAVAGTIPDTPKGRSASVANDLEQIERSITEIIPRAGDGDVHQIIARLHEEGFGDLLDRADSDLSERSDYEISERADSDPGLAQSLWVAVPASCVSKHGHYLTVSYW
jgi:hypothetical protein